MTLMIMGNGLTTASTFGRDLDMENYQIKLGFRRLQMFKESMGQLKSTLLFTLITNIIIYLITNYSHWLWSLVKKIFRCLGVAI